jgi:hypothetical protein
VDTVAIDPERSASLNLAGNARTVELAAGRSNAPATRRHPCAENAGAMKAGTSARERYVAISVASLAGVPALSGPGYERVGGCVWMRLVLVGGGSFRGQVEVAYLAVCGGNLVPVGGDLLITRSALTARQASWS